MVTVDASDGARITRPAFGYTEPLLSQAFGISWRGLDLARITIRETL